MQAGEPEISKSKTEIDDKLKKLDKFEIRGGYQNVYSNYAQSYNVRIGCTEEEIFEV